MVQPAPDPRVPESTAGPAVHVPRWRPDRPRGLGPRRYLQDSDLLALYRQPLGVDARHTVAARDGLQEIDYALLDYVLARSEPRMVTLEYTRVRDPLREQLFRLRDVLDSRGGR